MNTSKWASRKFTLVCCTILLLSGLLIGDKLGEIAYTQLIALLVSGYLLGNVVQNVKLEDKG
jgi:hypothetical protein